MAIFELYSQREKRRQLGDQDQLFQYDTLPAPFRMQVVNLWRKGLGRWEKPYYNIGPGRTPREGPNTWWPEICELLRHEYGVAALVQGARGPMDECEQYFMEAATDDALAVMEVAFLTIDFIARKAHPYLIRDYDLEDLEFPTKSGH
jgi:hypothetical protein